MVVLVLVLVPRRSKLGWTGAQAQVRRRFCGKSKKKRVCLR